MSYKALRASGLAGGGSLACPGPVGLCMGPVDFLVTAWCLFLAFVYLALVPEAANPVLGAAPYLILTAAILALRYSYDRLPGPLRLLRRTYPLFLMPQGFLDICRLGNLLHDNRSHDPLVRSWDAFLFGVEPAWWLRETFSSPWLSEALHGLYFSYFLLIAGTGLALELSSHPYLQRFQFRLATLWIANGLVYISFPVAGPHELRGSDYLQDTFFVRLMDTIYATTHHSGGAMPSSHVGVAWVCWASLYSYNKKYSWFALPSALGITVSTVYCRYHYLVDVIGGIVFALAFIPIADAVLDILRSEKRAHQEQGFAALVLRFRDGVNQAMRRIVG